MAKDDKTKRTTLGADIDTSSAMGAYQDALNAQRNIRSNWDIASDISSDVMGGIQEHRAAVQLDEENKLKELEAHENQFANNVAKITENSGSLGEGYYGLATEQAKLLQEEYMNAVRAGDKEAQTKIKMRLQGLSTGVGALKESLNIAAELKNEGLLSNGRTALEKEISDVCTSEDNAMYVDGEWVYKNPYYDPNDADKIKKGYKEFYTLEDFDKSLGQKEELLSQKFFEYETKQTGNGMNFVDGNKGASDFNFNRVKTSIADSFITEDTIMSIMHDDFRRAGESNTFKAHLEEYLQTSGLIESFHDNPKFDTEGGEGIDTEEEMKAVLEAIYNKDDDNYKYDVSKNIVADYLTRKSESKFYGEFKLDGKELTVKERRAIEPHDKETPESFKKRGGILGIWMNSPNAGVVWNEEYKYFSRTGDLDKLIEEEN